MRRTFSDEAIVLANRDYSEADRLVVLFSKGRGKLFLMAKGVRRLLSKKGGHLDVFSRIKFSASTSDVFSILTEVETIDAFPEIRKSLKKLSLAYYFMEALGRTTHEGETNRELFEMTLANLDRLRSEKNLKTIRLDFILKLIVVLGFWPKGKPLLNPDLKFEEIVERQLSSVRVGKILTRD